MGSPALSRSLFGDRTAGVSGQNSDTIRGEPSLVTGIPRVITPIGEVNVQRAAVQGRAWREGCFQEELKQRCWGRCPQTPGQPVPECMASHMTNPTHEREGQKVKEKRTDSFQED